MIDLGSDGSAGPRVELMDVLLTKCDGRGCIYVRACVTSASVECGPRAEKMQFSEELKYYFRFLRYLESNASYWHCNKNVMFPRTCS